MIDKWLKVKLNMQDKKIKKDKTLREMGYIDGEGEINYYPK